MFHGIATRLHGNYNILYSYIRILRYFHHYRQLFMYRNIYPAVHLVIFRVFSVTKTSKSCPISRNLVPRTPYLKNASHYLRYKYLQKMLLDLYIQREVRPPFSVNIGFTAAFTGNSKPVGLKIIEVGVSYMLSPQYFQK